MGLIGNMKRGNIKLHTFNTYLQGGAAYGAINTFENLINTYPEIEGTFFYMQDLSNGQKLQKLAKEKYSQRHPLSLNTSVAKRLSHSIKARKHYKNIQKSLKHRPKDYEQFSTPHQYYSTPYNWFAKQLPDIIHLNWIAEWIDYESFFNSIPNHIPIVWTLHDQNPMTAGCHYSWECQKYLSQCSQCPQLGPKDKSDLARIGHKIKANALKEKNLHIVGDSEWITHEAEKSTILKHAKSFQTIHYSIDFNIFKPSISNQQTRKKYNIPENAFVLCFGAADFTNRRKGFSELIQALEQINKHTTNVHCLVFGAGRLLLNQTNLPPIHLTGQLTPKELAEVYGASDIFVIPSLHEAFGLTAIEAMACGTPVIGFNTGGIPDSVKEGETGWLVKKNNSRDLAHLILSLTKNTTSVHDLSTSCLLYTQQNFARQYEANQYKQVFDNILNNNY